MLLSDVLEPDFIKLNVATTSWDGLVSQLLDTMYARRAMELPRPEIEAALASRTALGGIHYANGVSIPHARLDLFNNILIGMARPTTPIWHQGNEIKLLVLILTSRTTSNLYLNCLSTILRLLRQPDTFQALLDTPDVAGFMQVISSHDTEIETELSVENIMTSPVMSVAPETPIREVINILTEKGISYLPVLDVDRRFLGELTVIDILKLGIPNYAQLVGNTNQLKTFEPLEELLAREDTLCAGDIMELPTNVFTRDTSIVEAVFTFTKAKRRHVPVLEGDTLIGILSYMDILRKVLRA